MNGEKLLSAMTQISDHYVAEAGKPIRTKMIIVRRILPLAACFALIIAVMPYFMGRIGMKQSQQRFLAGASADTTAEAAVAEEAPVEEAMPAEEPMMAMEAPEESFAVNDAAEEKANGTGAAQIGPIMLGMSDTEVRELLGEPLSVMSADSKSDRFESAAVWRYQTGNADDQTFDLTLCLQNFGDGLRLCRIEAETGCPYTLQNGIGCGSTEDELIRCFDSLICTDSDSSRSVFETQLDGNFLQLITENGVVVQFSLGSE